MQDDTPHDRPSRALADSLVAGYAPTLRRIVEDIGARLEAMGYEPPAARDAAVAAVECLRAEWGGVQVYIPRDPGADAQAIWAQFNGRNIDELARRYDLTPRRIRQIVADMRRRAYRERQSSLPGVE